MLNMWERLLPSFRKSIVCAQVEAARCRRVKVTAEDLLVGCLTVPKSTPKTQWPPAPKIDYDMDETGARQPSAICLLTQLGFDAEALRQGLQVRNVTGNKDPLPGAMLLSDGGKSLIAEAYAQAKSLELSYMSSTFILIGALNLKDSVGADFVRDFGLTLEIIMDSCRDFERPSNIAKSRGFWYRIFGKST